MYSSILTDYYKDSSAVHKPNEKGESVIQIDIGLRKMTIPPTLSTIGVALDNNAERLFFELPRTFDGHDLSEEQILVRFINAGNEYGVFPVPSDNIDVSEDAMLFCWEISNIVTKFAGKVSFTVQIGTTNSYQYQTTPATLTVLNSLDIDKTITPGSMDSELLSNLAAQIAALNTQMASANSEIADLKTRVKYLEDNVIYAIDPIITPTI